MSKERPVAVGIGELLWDLLPAGAHLGGAPANFAYIASLLGAESIVVSRVGDDELGQSAQRYLQEHGLDTNHLQIDPEHSTGTVNVQLAADGTATYDIVESVAWDKLQWTDELEYLAGLADIVCFGSLVQRSAESRETVQRFLDNVRPDCLTIFDVNLRPPFCNAAVVRQSMRRAQVLKVNHEEVPQVLDFCSLPASADERAACLLQQHFSFRAVCMTRGPNGSVIATATETHSHPGIPIQVADTIGAGDAFTAALALQILLGSSVPDTSEAANRIAAWVASQNGAMPVPTPSERTRLQHDYGFPQRP